MSAVLQDLRHAVRSMAARPGIAVAAALSLGLAIGALTSVYCLTHTLFLRAPAGISDTKDIVAMSALERGRPVEDAIRYRDYLYYRDRATSFSELASHFNSGVAVADTDRAEELDAQVVSANYFSVLGVRPLFGRFFHPDEDVVPGRNPVAVLSHSFWQRRFGGDPDCVGAILKLNGTPFTIVGVGPADFEGAKAGWPVDVFIPNMMAALTSPGLNMLSRDSARLDLIGRLKAGRTSEAAHSEMRVLAAQLDAANPGNRERTDISFSSLAGVHPQARPAAKRLVRLLAVAVICLLIIACTNLAGLLLAANTTRRKEIAIRRALGAGTGRVIRQMLIESVLLALSGGAIALLFATWGNALLAGYYGTEIEGVRHAYILVIDWTAFLLTMTLGAATGVAFGMLPAVSTSRTDLMSTVKRDTHGWRRSRWTTAFLVAQVSISLVLIVGAALLLQSVSTLRSDPGFDSQRIAFFRMKPRLAGYDPERTSIYFRDLRRHLESLTDVESTAFVRMPPTLLPNTVAVLRPGENPSTPAENHRAALHLVTPGFFETLAIPIVSGRAFDSRDLDAQSVVVDQLLAARLWPNANPIGQTLLLQGKPFEIIGVAQYRGLLPGNATVVPHLFRVDWSSATSAGRLLVRVKDDARRTLAALTQEIVSVDPNVAISEALPLSALIENTFAEVPLALRVVGYAGGLGLLLTAIGLYGVLALAVGQREREIGVRMALGAGAASILRLIVREGIALAGVGVALGLGSAIGISRLLTRFLYGVTPTDLATYAAAAAVVGAVVLIACAIPAMRAARVDPITALRHE